MEADNSCRCCLVRPPDKYMKKPHSYLGQTEIFSDMLKECFELHLTVLFSDEECGICEVCVGRLRDARDFKLQVQRSQQELQARLDRAVKEENFKTPVKSDFEDDLKEDLIYDVVKSEQSEDPLPSDGEDNFVKYTREILVPVSDVYNWEPFGPETSLLHEPQASDIQNYDCTVCGKRFPRKLSLINHERVHKRRKQIRSGISGLSCEICSKQFTHIYYLNRHKLIHDKPHSCEQCSKRFTNKYILNKHESVHSGLKTHRCSECKKRFATNDHLKKHFKRLHTAQRAHYICDICNKQFAIKLSLIGHIGGHTGRQHFSCKTCSVSFWNYYSLSEHRKVHKVSKYTCHKCSRGFASKSELIRHIGKHSSRYSCEVCGATLSTPGSLRRHMLGHAGHRPYECKTCRKHFTQKHILLSHELTHTGEKPHCCEVCGKRFAKKGNLNTHLKTHVVGVAYGCEVCPKSYTTKEGLRQHKRVHTRKTQKNIDIGNSKVKGQS